MHECMIMASSKFFTVLFLVLLSHANSATETSFNIDAFNKTNLILQGDATVTSKGYLRLTDDTEDSMGRAFYSVPIQIRDSTTGNVASFSTVTTPKPILWLWCSSTIGTPMPMGVNLITYVSSKKVLTVSLLYPSTGTMYDLYAKKVELEEEVDDWVSVGFSATSGANQWSYETHDVLSWSFSSKFSDDVDTSERSNIVLNKIL
ncbi:hypothetical protein ACSQ67_009382 [Phaseolus vulgaris]